MAQKNRKKEALRPDTTLAPIGRPEAEVYVRELPACRWSRSVRAE